MRPAEPFRAEHLRFSGFQMRPAEPLRAEHLRFSGFIYLTLRARNKRLRKEPVAAENRIAPWSPSSIGSKIPASKTWQGSLCTTLARYDKILYKNPL